jgi:hypothetical protein
MPKLNSSSPTYCCEDRHRSGQVPDGRRTKIGATRLVADIFNRVTVALGEIADVPLRQIFGPVTSMRAEHRHTDLPLDDVLPLVGVRMPAQLAQIARLEVEDHARDRPRDREAAGIDAPLPAPLEDGMWDLFEEFKLVRLRRQLQPLEWGRPLLRWHRPAGEVHLIFRKPVKGRCSAGIAIGHRSVRPSLVMGRLWRRYENLVG